MHIHAIAGMFTLVCLTQGFICFAGHGIAFWSLSCFLREVIIPVGEMADGLEIRRTVAIFLWLDDSKASIR